VRDLHRVDAVRAFNRFYTRRVGVLGEHLLDSDFSLTEMRVLYELAHRRRPAASDLIDDLGLDAGYLSRILRRFTAKGLVASTPSAKDARRRHLRLTPKGRAVFAPFEDRSRDQVRAMIGELPPREQSDLMSAMDTIQRLLARGKKTPRAPYILRHHKPGDMGWVLQQHGSVYRREWHYNEEFEGLVARIVSDFLLHFDPTRERCWIAERGGENVGCVFVVSKSKSVAKLGLLLVDPAACGLGIGERLVDECVRFARASGYTKLTLWTQSELDAARKIYERAGFTCVDRSRHDSFGRKGLVAETWELRL